MKVPDRKDAQISSTMGEAHTRLLRLLDHRSFMPVCFICFSAVRIAVLFVRPLNLSADFAWYYGRALEIVSGTGFAENGVLTAFWPVGWPACLAALFSIFGTSILVGQIANLVFAAMVFVATAALATALFHDRAVGRLAVAMLAVYPNQIAYVPLLSTEIFYEAILLLAVLLLLRGTIISALLGGILFGVATLTKTRTLILPGFILAGVFLAAPSGRSLARAAALACAIYVMMALVIAPWTYRNYVVFHAIIPVSTNGGWTLLTGNNPEASGDYTPQTVLAAGISHDPAQQVVMDRLAKQRAIGWIEANPGQFLGLLPKKFIRLWAPDGDAEWFYQSGFAAYDANFLLFRAIRVVNQVYYFVIVLLAIPAILVLLRRPRAFDPWATAGISICLCFTLVATIFSGQSRMHFSIMPFIVIYSAWTVLHIASPRRFQAAAPALPNHAGA